MARLDVYRSRDGDGYLLDCQSDMLSNLDTKVTVPLFLYEDAPRPAKRLNPVFEVAGDSVVMMTQYATAIRVRDLGELIGNLDHQHDAVRDAFDMLLIGY